MSNVDPRLDEITDCLYRLAVKAIITSDSKVLLVKEEDDEFWSLPGGGIDHGETVHEALDRELQEELGIPAGAAQIKGEVIYVSVGAVIDGVPKANLFYRVSIPIEEVKPTRHVKEHLLVSIDTMRNLYLSPSIRDNEELIAVIDRLLT